MKFLKKLVFPALYGLLIYFTIRLIHDVETGDLFWKRAWALNSFEMSCSILTGYASVYLFQYLFKYYDKHWPLQFHYQSLIRELLILIVSNLILVNLILTPMAAFTDDGLSKADFVDICTVPTLYAIIYYGIARSRTYMMAYVNNKILLEKVTNDHLATELKFLKSQYHPHFLFNALNTIYFQMDDDLQGAKISIEKFSELLRYQLYDQQLLVPITNEIDYLKNFIELQKVRSSDKLQLKVELDKNLSEQLVYPLLFLPVVENAFKFIGGDYKLSISAELTDKQVNFRVENSIPEFEPLTVRKIGIGLENLRRRLDLLYPGKHCLSAKKADNTFVVELELEYE
ncbi:sensor histidine kinase [Pedobacter sp.]|jgi:two-component system LytT family sensor kinase|uniref:sensor histidine kinase n=1 Tax=Pedobacter sp. TaxID=1411316 RepID=UPI002CF7E049|nr:histidine kinase [Pedobacter sp.]HWW38522.1 histidine kinase [Pedobacter sp.]